MQNNINKLKRTFLLLQIGILSLITLLYITTTSIHLIWQQIETTKTNLNKTAVILAATLRDNSTNPSNNSSDDLLVYTIDKTTRSLSSKRTANNNHDNIKWALYKKKILYEISKIERGWIIYPDVSPWNLVKHQNIIRYIPIENTNNILVLESPIKNPIQTIFTFFGPTELLKLTIILLSGLFFMVSIYENNLLLISNIISERTSEKDSQDKKLKNNKNIEEPKLTRVEHVTTTAISTNKTLTIDDQIQDATKNSTTKEVSQIPAETELLESKETNLTDIAGKKAEKKDNVKPKHTIKPKITDDIFNKIKNNINSFGNKSKNKTSSDEDNKNSNLIKKGILSFGSKNTKDPATIIGQAFSLNPKKEGRSDKQMYSKEQPKNKEYDTPNIEKLKISLPKDKPSKLTSMLKEMRDRKT